MSEAPESSAQFKVGPIFLAEGVRRFNFWTFMYAAFICIGMLAGMNFIQSYVLTEHLQIPSAEQRAVTGILAFWTEIVTILLIVPFGILSDRIGRRPVMVGGILFLALGYALFPFATSVGELTLYRIIYSVGAAALSALIAIEGNDYTDELSRIVPCACVVWMTEPLCAIVPADSGTPWRPAANAFPGRILPRTCVRCPVGESRNDGPGPLDRHGSPSSGG